MNGITHCIDWFQYSVKLPEGESPVDVIERARPQHPITVLTGELGTNISGYDRCLKMGAGRCHYHTLHPENKLSMQWTGQDLSATAEAGLSIETMLQAATAFDCWSTRIDFAIDIKGTPARQLDILEGLNSGSIKTMAQRWGAYLGFQKIGGKVYQDGTVYVGSPSSQRMLRVYDKGKERGTKELWTRVELVSRKDASHALAGAMVRNDIGATGRTAVREYIQTDVAWFEEALQSETVYIQPVEKPTTDTRRWLLQDVLPILDRMLKAETLGDSDTLYKAVERVLYSTKQIKERKPVSES